MATKTQILLLFFLYLLLLPLIPIVFIAEFCSRLFLLLIIPSLRVVWFLSLFLFLFFRNVIFFVSFIVVESENQLNHSPLARIYALETRASAHRAQMLTSPICSLSFTFAASLSPSNDSKLIE